MLPVSAKALNNGVYEIKTDKEIEVLGALTELGPAGERGGGGLDRGAAHP